MVSDPIHPSDSKIQREIEVAVLGRLEKKHPGWERVYWQEEAAGMGLSLTWQKVKPDAVWRTRTEKDEQLILAECYLRTGALTAGHIRKMAMDVLKLLALSRAVPSTIHLRCVLVVPVELSDRLTGPKWINEALRLVEILPVVLQKKEREKLNSATVLQASGQARTRRTEKDA